MASVKEKEKPAQKDSRINSRPETENHGGVKIVESESDAAINPNT